MALNLNSGQVAERKLLITVAEWTGASYTPMTLISTEPASFDPTDYYKKSSSGTLTDQFGQKYAAGSSGDAWALNTWYSAGTATTTYREILGTRTEDSSIEFNADVETTTDIRGITYTDVNKTEPQQDLDPFYVMGGSALSEYMTRAALKNNISAYNNVFTAYIIAAYIQGDSATTSDGKYYTVKHSGCSIIPTSLGGDAKTAMPIEIHYSNNITEGTVDKLADNFTFTPAA